MAHILKGNDLRTGEVNYWTGSAWSPRLAEAHRYATEAEALADTTKDAVRLPVIDLYALAVDGNVPASLRERINATGPTVRLDLARATGA